MLQNNNTNTDTGYYDERFEKFITKCHRCSHENDQKFMRKVYSFARENLGGWRNETGDNYIDFLLDTAGIVTGEIGLGTTSAASLLLYGVFKEADCSIEDIIDIFGKQVSEIIIGLEKFEKLGPIGEMQDSEHKRFFQLLIQDVRIPLIQLALHLQIMRYLKRITSITRQHEHITASVTFFVPFCHRLGLYVIKTELEDLCMKYRQPQVYAQIESQLEGSRAKRQRIINKFSLPIIQKLDEEGIEFDIDGRPKSIFSIWTKMTNKQIPFEEVFDKFAIRIIFKAKNPENENNECRQILNWITDIYEPRDDRFRNWLETPKMNGYKALHATVKFKDYDWVEVQIRSKAMNEIAEFGVAAHWKYKGQDSAYILDDNINMIKKLLNDTDSDALNLLNNYKVDILSDEIPVFTPKDEVFYFPHGSTILDFAFRIHTGLALKCIGAKIKTKIVPISYQMKVGDQIEILTSENQKPEPHWINFAKTPKARNELKMALKYYRRPHILKGRDMFYKLLEENNIKPSSNLFKKLRKTYSLTHKEELFLRIGTGIIIKDELINAIGIRSKSKMVKFWSFRFLRAHTDEIANESQENNFYIGLCCSPIPGDPVMGIPDENGKIEVHSIDCKYINNNEKKYQNVVQVRWHSHKQISFLANLKLNGFDRIGLVNNVSETIYKEMGVILRSINFESNEGVFNGNVEVYVYSQTVLNNLIFNLMTIKGVRSVYKIETDSKQENDNK